MTQFKDGMKWTIAFLYSLAFSITSLNVSSLNWDLMQSSVQRGEKKKGTGIKGNWREWIPK